MSNDASADTTPARAMSKRPVDDRRATSRAAHEPTQDPVFGTVRLTHAQREVFGDTCSKLDVARY